ncbi:helix-turn-helix domain-containing protein [Kocuria rosea]|uniref:helix-turn-helix domain-containing protein n=1 Tax=Kocuria rosea TaxID=1275 RepID=UPI00232AD94F|nr:helix-turn-helix domain-containing protein [Kocuria rosea]
MTKTTVDSQRLYATLEAAKNEQGMSWRELAKEIGVSPSLLSRLGNGLKPDANSFATLVDWLRMPAETFFDHEGEDTSGLREPQLMTKLAPLLRAEKSLSPEDVEYLEKVISATVAHVKSRG